jgi:hypothetical protein
MAAIAGIAIGLIGAGVSASGSSAAGRRAKKFGEVQAQDALARGRETEDELKSGVRKLLGEQHAGFAAQGVSLADADSSAAQVAEDTLTQQNADIRRIRLNAAREAWGYRTNARTAQRAENADATGTILGGLGQAFTGYSRSENYR